MALFVFVIVGIGAGPATGPATAPATRGSYDLSSPEAPVKLFFTALDKNDLTTLRRIVSPRVLKALEDDGLLFEPWLRVWKQYPVISIGEAEKPQFSEYRNQSISKVPVTFRWKGKPVTNLIKVCRDGDEWHWDEN